MQTCSKCQTQSADDVRQCPKCQADLREFSTTAQARLKFLKNERVQRVSIVVAHDCCPACRSLEGAYPKDAVPTLPAPGCSHELGCRCFYQPFLSELYP